MSFGIVRIQKLTSGSVKGIEIHDRREKEGISHTNKDIDWSRTKLNYDICPDQNKSFTRTVKDKISNLKLKRAVRKDAIVMAQALVTSDSEFFKIISAAQQKQFFEQTYKFLCERYGEKNVVSAIVHLDEKTPHMHFNFVPVTLDGHLSAKKLFTPITLKNLQTEFYQNVGKNFGLERGLEDSKENHLPVLEYKLSTVSKKLSETILENNKAKSQLEPLKAEYEAKKAYIDECDKLSEISTSIPDYAKVNKTLFGKETVTIPLEMWEKRHISANEKSYIKKATEEFEKAIEDYQKSSSAENLYQLQEELINLRKTIATLLEENKQLKNEKEELKIRVMDTFKLLPEQAQKDFLENWNGKSYQR